MQTNKPEKRTDLVSTATAKGDGLRLRFVPESDLSAGDHTSISALLVAAFPEHADIFRTASWYGGRPDHRLWLEAPDGAVAAHLDFERRIIGVNDREVLVAGVGEVATHPELRGRGLGRWLMAELRRVLTTETLADFGYLGCREEVVGFYERAGWCRPGQKTREIDPGSGKWTVSKAPTLILPATAPLSAWPGGGIVDLRGMWW